MGPIGIELHLNILNYRINEIGVKLLWCYISWSYKIGVKTYLADCRKAATVDSHNHNWD